MRCLRPKYLKKFRCDGSKCSSRCCRGWRVAIDRDTHEKFLALDDRDYIIEKLEFIEAENVFAVKLKPDGSCPFLDDDLLCSIQKKHGENFLAAICQAYPRITYRLGEQTLEQSLTLTCPPAARSILLAPEPIEFETVELEPPRFIFDWTKKIPDAEHAIELQLRAIELLQDRSRSIDQRLFDLCRALGDWKKIRAEFDLERHAEIMLTIFFEMYSADADELKRRRIKNIFVSEGKTISEELRREFGSVLENYLVNEFFMRCHPFAFDGDIAFNCRVFVIGFKAIEFALVLTAISKGGRLNVDELLKMIDALNERLDHNRGGMRAVQEVARALDDPNEFVSTMLNV